LTYITISEKGKGKMMKVSSNRLTQIRVVEDGKVVKTVSNASINFGQDLENLKKMIEIAIRLSPQDPIYLADKLVINLNKNQDVVMDQNELEQLQNALFKQEVVPGTKVSMTVSRRLICFYNSKRGYADPGL
jgi:hypothetical protein